MCLSVSDIMTANPVTIRQDGTIREALGKMAEIGCHHLPVLSDDGHLIGVVSDNDCHVALNLPYKLRNEWRGNQKASSQQIRSVMTPAPIVVEPGTIAVEAARLMLYNHISCLPVMRGETLIGIITTSDILMAFIRSNKEGLPTAGP